MIKLNEADGTSNSEENEKKIEVEEAEGEKETFEPFESSSGSAESDLEKKENVIEDKEIDLWFKMNFNPCSSDSESKRCTKSEENKNDAKRFMYFNKEVMIRSEPSTPRNPEVKKSVKPDKDLKKSSPLRNAPRNKSRFGSHKGSEPEFGKPQISDPGMMFSSSLSPSFPEAFVSTRLREAENLKAFLAKRNPKIESNSLVVLSAHPSMRTDLRLHNSLTSLPRLGSKIGIKGVLKSKIPSLTAIEVTPAPLKTGTTRFGYWDHWDDLTLMQSDVDKRLNLQISRSCNDNTRRLPLKFKKEDAASVSDSKLLFADSETKKQIKKCDKKSRGDSSRKERDARSRKQVQWKTEVDVIYFSTHQAANGDRSGEVIGRVMEPLREEWQQQRKGFYAKTAPYHLESHLKDHFISLLKI